MDFDLNGFYDTLRTYPTRCGSGDRLLFPQELGQMGDDQDEYDEIYNDEN